MGLGGSGEEDNGSGGVAARRFRRAVVGDDLLGETDENLVRAGGGDDESWFTEDLYVSLLRLVELKTLKSFAFDVGGRPSGLNFIGDSVRADIVENACF